jgi:hypothetical protein
LSAKNTILDYPDYTILLHDVLNVREAWILDESNGQ